MEVFVPLDGKLESSVAEPLIVESRSAPPGGTIEVSVGGGGLELLMRSTDLSTARAMLNSYLGLLEAALDAALSG